MDIKSLITNHRRIMIDTAPLIYFIEDSVPYGKIAGTIISNAIQYNCSIITSVITLVEVLTQPIQMKRFDIAEKYRDVLTNSKNIIMYPVDSLIAQKAAELRAKYQIKTPDALQIATCIENNATLFITNDMQIKQIKEIEVAVLRDFI